MAASAYDEFVDGIMGGINLTSDTVQALLIDTDEYTFDASDSFADIPSEAKVSGPITLTSKTVTGGQFKSDTIQFPSVTGTESEAVIIYDSTAGKLVSYLGGKEGATVTPDGNNINVSCPEDGWVQIAVPTP